VSPSSGVAVRTRMSVSVRAVGAGMIESLAVTARPSGTAGGKWGSGARRSAERGAPAEEEPARLRPGGFEQQRSRAAGADARSVVLDQAVGQPVGVVRAQGSAVRDR